MRADLLTAIFCQWWNVWNDKEVAFSMHISCSKSAIEPYEQRSHFYPGRLAEASYVWKKWNHTFYGTLHQTFSPFNPTAMIKFEISSVKKREQVSSPLSVLQETITLFLIFLSIQFVGNLRMCWFTFLPGFLYWTYPLNHEIQLSKGKATLKIENIAELETNEGVSSKGKIIKQGVKKSAVPNTLHIGAMWSQNKFLSSHIINNKSS